MSIEKGPNSALGLPAGENNLVSLTGVLEIISRSSLLSVQKTALAEALKKGLQKRNWNPEFKPIGTLNSPQIETQQITPAKDNESRLLVKLEEVFKIDTDPDSLDNEEDRAGVVVKTAEAYRELATDLVELLKENNVPNDLNLQDLNDEIQKPQDLTGNILESVTEAMEQLKEESMKNPDLKLIVRTVLEFQGINFDYLFPSEQRMIFSDLERQGIDGPESKQEGIF